MKKSNLLKMVVMSLLMWTSLPFNQIMANSLQDENAPISAHTQDKKRCKTLLREIGFSTLHGITLIGSGLLGLTQGSNWVGYFENTPYLGLSIYLDYPSILSFLTPEERDIFKNPQKNVSEIVKILCAHLSLRNEDNFDPLPYLKPEMASSYFSSTPPKANMCRHKALILKGVLEHLKIEAKLITGSIETDSGGRGDHVWVYVPSIHKSADPMNNIIDSPEEYEKTMKAKITYGVIQWAKPIGIIGR